MSNRSFTDLVYGFYTNYWQNAKMNSNEESTATKERTTEDVTLDDSGQGDGVYHAVYVPLEDINGAKEDVWVYRDKIKALKAMKNYKRARLKTFASHQEARDYTLNGGEKEKIFVAAATNDEKVNNFKGPKPQELVAFRKLIESGDLETVKNIVWENPRYLISSGDTPAILQEGCRYNALHIVASKGQTNTSQMCELILNTVGNPDFVKLLDGEEKRKGYVDRAHVLLDLYLNTPDKGLNETPLHFAVKYGLKDIVRVLVSYSQCMKNLRNKYEQTPMEIICSRKCQEDEELKKEVRALLEDQYYVPVLRADDNSMQPVIGDPFSPTSPQRTELKFNPISPRLEVRAFAGPMTKPQAMQFRKKWKTPPRMNLNYNQRKDASLNDSLNNLVNCQDPCMRLNDTEKGLEREGRDLAKEYDVPWKEFWNFLNDFADFDCDEGLVQMEKYMEKRFNDDYHKKEIVIDKIQDKARVDEMNNLCAKLKSWSLEQNENISETDTDEEFFTPPSSPDSSLMNYCHDSDCEEEMSLADEGPGTFIEGSAPSRIDFAVYNAISNNINPDVYPFIYHWRHEMKLIIENNHFDHNCSVSSMTRLPTTPMKPRTLKF